MSSRRRLVDYHVHSTHSSDTHYTLFEMCQKAVELGITEIGFSEHKDFEPTRPYVEFFNYERYTADIERAREIFKGKLVIRKGLEVGYQSCFDGKVRAWLHGKDFDFIIGSVHFIDHTIVNDLFKAEHDLEQIYAKYFCEVIKSIESGLFDVVGHLDVIRKFTAGTTAGLNNFPYEETVRKVLKTVTENEMFLEVNMRVLMLENDSRYPMTIREIYEKYFEDGGRLISIGSDAHSPTRLSNGAREIRDFLTRYGEEQIRLLFE